MPEKCKLTVVSVTELGFIAELYSPTTHCLTPLPRSQLGHGQEEEVSFKWV